MSWMPPRAPAKARLCPIDSQNAVSAGFDPTSEGENHGRESACPRGQDAAPGSPGVAAGEAALFNSRFAADRRFKEKFERLAEVLGVENPLQHVRDHGAGPGHRPRQEGPEEKACTATRQGGEAERRSSQEKTSSRRGSREREEKANSRHIPSEVRERVHERAGYQREYRGPGGTAVARAQNQVRGP